MRDYLARPPSPAGFDIADYLASTLGPRFEPPELLRRMVREGKLGRKSGRGFYEWKDEG